MRLKNTATDTMPAERITLSCAADCPAVCSTSADKKPPELPLSVLFEEVSHGPDAQIVVFDAELLGGRMKAVVGKAEAHQHGGNPEVSFEIADDWDRAAAACEDRGTAQDIAERARGNVDGG